MMQRLQERYRDEVVPAMMEQFSYDNVMQAPRLVKVVLNVGLAEALQNPRALDAASNDLIAITGQRPVITRARRSIAAFKLREGNPIGVKVTLRREKMWAFLDRMISIALPRQRDFRGVSRTSFDGRGNYTLGLREQLGFVELDYDAIDKVRGFEATIVTTAETDEQALFLLEQLGMPFVRVESEQMVEAAS